ncbi:DUF3221 domain-containing protein [Saccharibacillus endophyticus]|uniref:DUF3221 domain-containing protein n=1 Tax=Saccharibacillus endophyticus TaxID=2060666 RepID=A0ABQ1ZZA6_9BACL|nr:DUF3221 domain-containing protein [Saccharibacillus endophyticus]GGH82412.1 hypothetical protein GCM10007362_33690 [Saccharibacillus endophyticus]
MPNTKFADAKTLTKNGTRKGKAATLCLWVLVVGLVLSGCGQKPVDTQTGAANAEEPAKTAEPLIADCNLPPDPNPDDSEPDGAIDKTEKSQPSDTPSYPGTIGYVVKKEGSNILVVSPEGRKLGSGTGDGDYYEATWFGAAPEEIQVGMKVEAWAVRGQVEDSYPGQAGAEKVEVQNGGILHGANLSEAEVVREAIEQLEPSDYSFFIVRAAEYHPDEDAWTVELLDEQRELVRIKIEDRAA